MRLEPVQLVAPEPSPSTMASRRAFLIAGGTFFAGLGLGGSIGLAAPATSVAPRQRQLPEHDELLSELRDLATNGSIDELIGERYKLLHFVQARFHGDQTLLQGVNRLARACLSMPSYPERMASARSLANVIDKSTLADTSMRDIARRLRQLR